MPSVILVLTLILLGFVLLVIELFVIPGFGIVGISGLFCLGLAGYISYLKFSPLAAVLVSILSVAAIILLIKILPHTNIYKKMRLETTTSRKAGFSAERSGLSELMGKEGITLTPLHPVGTAVIGGKRIDVVSEVGMIDKDSKVVVVKVEGNKVVVRG